MSEILVHDVAIIGSFKQNYPEVLEAWQTFTDNGLVVRSPKGSPIIEQGIDFVRFESDDPNLTDEQVEQVALHRILGADFVYAIVPEGYVGKLTSREIGRVTQANHPLYFSEKPQDIALEVPSDHIAKADELVERFREEMPRPLLDSLTGLSYELEYDLHRGHYPTI